MPSSLVTRRRFLRTSALTAAAAGVPAWAAAGPRAAARRPNFVFLLVDDLGRSDLGCYGNPFHETLTDDQANSS